MPENRQVKDMKRIETVLERLPDGRAGKNLTEGCLVLEGGAFRGLYTGGVVDTLMQNGINIRTVIGVSAGALYGLCYCAGRIGWPSRFNISHCMDSTYAGLKAYRKNQGVIGFDIVFEEFKTEDHENILRIMDPARRMVAVATNCLTGEATYLEKTNCSDIFQAVKASASMQVLSRMVYLDGIPYLDGGNSDFIPVDWAIREGFEKIIVVKTRERGYRDLEGDEHVLKAEKYLYHNFPSLCDFMMHASEKYNALMDHIDALEREKRIYVIAPSESPDVMRLEKNPEKLYRLYRMGVVNTERRIGQIRRYLGLEETGSDMTAGI